MKKFDLGEFDITTENLIKNNGETICLEKFHFKFNEWTEHHSFDTYNGKAILNFENEPLFAEILILRLLEKNNYKGVWVDTYRNKYWQRLPHFSFPVIIDKKIEDVLNAIYIQKGGKKAGCFDVVAYNESNFIFIELKRKGKDSIRDTQIEWLDAARKLEIENSRYIIAEWDF
jgi:hypothetical protein